MSLRIDYVDVTRITASSARVERVGRVWKPGRLPVWYTRADAKKPKKGDVLEVYREGNMEAWVLVQ